MGLATLDGLVYNISVCKLDYKARAQVVNLACWLIRNSMNKPEWSIKNFETLKYDDHSGQSKFDSGY